LCEIVEETESGIALAFEEGHAEGYFAVARGEDVGCGQLLPEVAATCGG
jgi:hypothetical protein